MRYSYDAFVLNNKRDALYYSGPFAASQQTVVLNPGEVYRIDAVNVTGTVTAAVTGSGTKPTATVSGNEVVITTTSSTSTGDFVLTLTDTPATGTAVTTTVAVTVV